MSRTIEFVIESPPERGAHRGGPTLQSIYADVLNRVATEVEPGVWARIAVRKTRPPLKRLREAFPGFTFRCAAVDGEVRLYAAREA